MPGTWYVSNKTSWINEWINQLFYIWSLIYNWITGKKILDNVWEQSSPIRKQNRQLLLSLKSRFSQNMPDMSVIRITLGLF